MTHTIGQLALLVRDYDEAIAWYTTALGFELLEDTDLGGGKRWVRVGPAGGACTLLLARASNDEQRACIGRQTGGRVFLFLYTDDCARDYRDWSRRGVVFTGPPRNEDYGTVTVFRDLYGNLWDLIQRRAP